MVFLLFWHSSIERGNDNSYSQKGSEINSVPFIKFLGIIVVLKNIGGTHNSPVFKWPAYWIRARETHLCAIWERAEEQILNYLWECNQCLEWFWSYPKAFAARPVHTPKHAVCVFCCVLILQMLSWPHIQAYY